MKEYIRVKKMAIYINLNLVLFFLLSSCSLVPEPHDQPQKFILKPCEKVFVSTLKNDGIVIDTPTVYCPLDTTRVAILPTTLTLDYIADVEWADRLAPIIHDTIIQSFQNSHAFASTGRLSSSLQANLMLKVDVRKFQQNAVNHHVEIEYYVQLLSLPNRSTVASTMIKSEIPLSDQASATEIMNTFSKTNQDCMCRLMTWITNIKNP